MRFLPLLFLAAAATAVADDRVDIPFETFTLDNGLRVVVHTDRKAPVVAVNIWYHVGSKDEQPGKTGFAHLFEHLMFQGTENYNDEFFKPFELVGATNMNGTTNFDRTNYFANVPTTALDLGLWMASEQMGHFLGAVDQARLDEQRGVVQNEKRQSENQPYGMVFDHLLPALFPAGHPYHHLPIGSMADLNAANLEDVRWWFRTWYGPNNAVLVLAGDIDLATAKDKVTRFFGDIPAGPDTAQPKPNVPQRKETTREVITDRVAQPRIYRAWTQPKFGEVDGTHLQLLGHVYSGSATSRLTRRLVHEEKLADSVSGFGMAMQVAGMAAVIVDVKTGVDVAAVEKILDEEWDKLLADGLTAAELEQTKTVVRAGFVRQIERIGGFGGKADVLAECAVFAGNPGCFREELATIDAASADDLIAAGKRWTANKSHTVIVQPGERVAAEDDKPSAAHVDAPAVAKANPKFKTVASDVDRSKGPPMTETFPDLAFPDLQRDTLDNGLKLILARREGLPLVQMSLELGGGYSADVGRKLGTSSFAMTMLGEGAGDRDALAFAAAAESLGANIGSSASLDAASIRASALKDKLAPTLALFADVVLRPRFDQPEIERVRAQWLAGIAQEKTQPGALASRLLPPLIYGEGHPYGIPFTGSGNEASINALTRDDLVAFHRDWVRPDNATLIVVGDIGMADLKRQLNTHFGAWKSPDKALPTLDRRAVALPAAQRVFLVDQPGSSQANIMVAQVVPPTSDKDSLPFDLANDVFSGNFTARLNMNLREDKAWSYGAYGSASNAVGQRPWIAYAPVQIDQTAPSMQEIARELREYTGDKPATAEEINKVQSNQVRRLPGAYETGASVLNAIASIVRFDRPDDYVQTLKERIEGVTDAQVRSAADRFQPGALTWVVVGDLGKIEPPIRALELGEVRILDSDGKPVERAASAEQSAD